MNRVVKRCKQLFSFAVRSRLLDRSPFAYVRGGVVGGTSHDQRHFVTREEIAAVLNACPDHEWRLLVALSRFGGLRIPSEALELKWSDINWERNRIVVPVPKLEHVPGHETRVVPIFPELRTYLETAFSEAADGAVYVISKHRGDNLRTQLTRIIHKASLKRWPKVWHAMRASRQTELSASFPLHVVCSWIGNSAVSGTRALPDRHRTGFHQRHHAGCDDAIGLAPKTTPVGRRNGPQRLATQTNKQTNNPLVFRRKRGVASWCG